MAWTTSACLRARLHLADTSDHELHAQGKRDAGLAVTALRLPPAIVLSLGALSLGALAPLLPTNLTAIILLAAGIALAVLGTGANLADVAAAETTPADEPAYRAAPPVAQTLAPSLPAPAKAIGNRSAATAMSHDWPALMARINHELRTPLNAVVGFSEVMALNMFGPLGNERYEEYVRHIRDSAGDLLKSAEDTLALTGLLTDPRPGEAVVACRLDHAVADAWAFVERKAEAREVGLALHLPEEMEVMSEPRALRQILVNLISEGIGRAAPGGSVSILAVADGELAEIAITADGVNRVGPGAGSLAVSLARTLLEMQGTSLLELETAAGWKAVTVLDLETQPDFFAARMPVQYEAREVALAV